MVHPRCWRGGALAVGVVLTSSCAGGAWAQETKIDVAESFGLVRIYADAEGESHFGLEHVSFELADFAPPAPPISVSQVQAAEAVAFISSPPGWYGDWHPAPRRQLMFCLAGELEVTVSDGETRRFRAGCAVLVEDTVGKGHVSRVVGSERCLMAAVPLEEAAK